MMRNTMIVLGTAATFGFAMFANAAMNAALSDKQIAMALITINQGEINAGELAKSKSKNAEVQSFAGTMVAQHQQNEKDTKALAKKDSIGMEKSELSETLEKDAKTANKELLQSKADMFDKDYVAQQVQMHEKALSTLKEQLIPGTKNADLKAHLEKTQAAVMEHLGHAKTLQAKLSKM